MENILSQIPQSVIDTYKIEADEKTLYVFNSGNFIGFLSDEIQIEEDEFVVKIKTKTCVFSMWKNVKTTHMTIF